MDSQKRLVVCDWKRSRKIRTENPFRSLREPLENLCDSNYWKYALQLNLYAFILEDQYGYSVGSLYIFVVHPSEIAPRIIEVPRLEQEMQLLVEHELAIRLNAGASRRWSFASLGNMQHSKTACHSFLIGRVRIVVIVLAVLLHAFLYVHFVCQILWLSLDFNRLAVPLEMAPFAPSMPRFAGQGKT